MKANFKLFYIVLLGIVVFSCKNEPIMFDNSKTFVAFVSDEASVVENENVLEVPLMVAALSGSPAVSVSFEVVTDGISNPAVEGTDFTVTPGGSVDFPEGSGMVNLSIHPIDNDQFTGNKYFKIRITSNSKGYNSGAEDEVTIELKDNEHPLAAWIGIYDVAAVSYGSPGAWDESWVVTTEADPDDVNNLLISGIGGEGSGPVSAVINLEEMTLTLSPGQTIGDPYGYGNISIYKGTEAGDDIITDEPLVGVIEEDGTIRIDLLGMLITDGDYAGYLYDVFNSTWTKR